MKCLRTIDKVIKFSKTIYKIPNNFITSMDALIEKLKVKAREVGLWNLWRPKSHGGTLTNLTVAPAMTNAWTNLMWSVTNVAFAASASNTLISFASPTSGTNGVLLCHMLGLDPVPWEGDRFVTMHSSITRLRSFEMADGHTFSLTRLSDVEHIPADSRTS